MTAHHVSRRGLRWQFAQLCAGETMTVAVSVCWLDYRSDDERVVPWLGCDVPVGEAEMLARRTIAPDP